MDKVIIMFLQGTGVAFTETILGGLTISMLAWKKVVSPFTGSRENCKKLFLHLCPKLMRKNYMPKYCWKYRKW